jgi:hypothetical protein
MVSVVQIHTLTQADRRVKCNTAKKSEILSVSVYKNVNKYYTNVQECAVGIGKKRV